MRVCVYQLTFNTAKRPFKENMFKGSEKEFDVIIL